MRPPATLRPEVLPTRPGSQSRLPARAHVRAETPAIRTDVSLQGTPPRWSLPEIPVWMYSILQAKTVCANRGCLGSSARPIDRHPR